MSSIQFNRGSELELRHAEEDERVSEVKKKKKSQRKRVDIRTCFVSDQISWSSYQLGCTDVTHTRRSLGPAPADSSPSCRRQVHIAST